MKHAPICFFAALMTLMTTANATVSDRIAPRCDHLFADVLKPAQGELAYKIYGRGNSKTLVLVHGMGGDLTSFDNMIEAFAQNYKVVVYDQRGHGNSVARGEDYSTLVMAADLKALVDHLGLKTFSLLGHSMGARVAARFTALYPEQVDALVIEDMDLIRRSNATAEFQRRVILKSRELKRRLEMGRFETRDSLEIAIAPFLNSPDLAGAMERAERVDGSWTIRPPFPPDVYNMYWFQANTDDDLLASLNVADRPTLMLRADDQQYGSIMTDEGVRQAQKQFPKAVIQTVPDSDHGIHHSAPRDFYRRVSKFLAQATSRHLNSRNRE